MRVTCVHGAAEGAASQRASGAPKGTRDSAASSQAKHASENLDLFLLPPQTISGSLR